MKGNKFAVNAVVIPCVKKHTCSSFTLVKCLTLSCLLQNPQLTGNKTHDEQTCWVLRIFYGGGWFPMLEKLAVSIETCVYFAKYGRGYLPSLLPLLEIEPTVRSSGAESSAIDVACNVVLIPLHILPWIILLGLFVSDSGKQ
ncbi:hypothetical protein IMY05_013G0082800 [Salix suchowensis]|nr:hypothetical protein IMY05_013G0082800 [Salix suchowensis]